MAISMYCIYMFFGYTYVHIKLLVQSYSIQLLIIIWTNPEIAGETYNTNFVILEQWSVTNKKLEQTYLPVN